ncbi:zinc finger protein 623 isoform X1 [Rhipicephalus sanguineus]|uniref:zinc finger protein 623 isoform X1 n=1 Tax=Rhipicephalus sanguineus TaxID=34632 RepID=UPI0018955A4D|nr:zinc finger protein 623 isoform X1 [Rhipicephalus sanguineus]
MPAVEVREEREKCNRLLEVFDDVHAFLSDRVVRSIPESIEVFFRDNGVPGKLSEDVSDACLRYIIHGSFIDILAARKILQKHLLQQDTVDLQRVAEADDVALSEAFQDHYVDVASHEVIGADVIEDCPELAAEEDGFCSPSETTLLVNVVAESGACSEFCSSDLQHSFDQIEAVASDVSAVALEKEPQQVSCDPSAVPNPVVIEIHCSKLEDAMLNLPLDLPPSQDNVVEQFMEDPTAVAVTCTTDQIAEDSGGDNVALEPVTEVQKQKRNYEEVTPFKYFCELCSFKTKRNSHYLKHIKIHEKVTTLHSCDKCSFTTMRLGHLRRHASTHSNHLHRCTHCSYTTDDQKLLLRHNRMRHYRTKRSRQAPAKPMECPHCNYRTTRPLLLARHRQRHAGDSGTLQSSAPLHQCTQCGYQTHRKEHLVRHRANVHGGARPFLCHRCGKAFKRADALRQHHLTHAGPNEGAPPASFACPQCHKVFRTHSHLSEHQAIHSTARPFLCEICGSAFKTRSVQRKHVQSVHNNPRAFCCSCCTKKFNTQYALKRHQKLHQPPSEQQQRHQQPAQPHLLAPPSLPLPEEQIHAATTLQDVLGSTAPAMSGPVAEVPGLEHVITTVPIQDTCDVIGQISTAMLQPAETATLLYLTNPLPPF